MRMLSVSQTLTLFTLIYPCAIFGFNQFFIPGASVPQKDSKAIYFSGAGIYFWWQAGCARYIQENCDFSQMPIIGASAGSISATLLLSSTDFERALDVALDLGKKAGIYERKTGLAGIWGSILKEWLEEIIPDTVTENVYSKLQIAVTPSIKTPKLVTGFKCKADVIEACMASCHVPLFLDGRPTTNFRGEQVIDGSFWYFVTKNRITGLPIPPDVKPDEIFWVDYCDDENFMQSISGNMLGLVSPDRVSEMMDDGYNFMKREHYNGRLPMAKYLVRQLWAY
jgi:hypothetical protein